jgi:hypothetical protein
MPIAFSKNIKEKIRIRKQTQNRYYEIIQINECVFMCVCLVRLVCLVCLVCVCV